LGAALLTLQTCICTPTAQGGGNCLTPCQKTCTGQGTDSTDPVTGCTACEAAALGGACATEFGACINDPCAP
jgi:hypothetical protein